MAKLMDFRKTANGWYRINIKSPNPEDFRRAIRRLKEHIAFQERGWWEKDREWEVKITSENEGALAGIFENGASCIEMVKSQMRMF